MLQKGEEFSLYRENKTCKMQVIFEETFVKPTNNDYEKYIY